MSHRERRLATSSLFAALFPLQNSMASALPDAPTSPILDAESMRPHFMLDWSFTHLNHGSYGTAPRAVLAAARTAAEAVEAFPDDFFRRRALGQFKALSDTVGAFVGAPPGSCVLLDNATTAVNTMLRGLSLKPGDHILINDNTYNACKNAAHHAASRVAGAEVVTFSFPFPLTDEAGLLATLQATLDAHPRAVFILLDHITSPTGVVMPIAAMAAAAKARGVLVGIDGAHAPGMLPLDMAALESSGVDWYTGNLHKWCFTPKGVAFMFTSAAHREATQSNVVSHFWQQPYQNRFYMQGTNDQSRYAAVPAAFAFMKEVLGGVEAMRASNVALAAEGAARLCAAWGTERMAPSALCAPFLVAIRTPLDFRRFMRAGAAAATVEDEFGPRGDPALASLPLSEAAVVVAADGGINERVATFIFRKARIQSQFFVWEYAGQPAIFCRISAQVYNKASEYDALAAAVTALDAASRGEGQW